MRDLFRFTSVISVASFAAMASAQPCDHPHWIPVQGLSGNGEASVEVMTVWDPDGPGPESPQLVIGGTFTHAEGQRVNRVVAWRPATGAWSALGDGVDGTVRAFAVLPDGDLVAAGTFTQASGVEDANNIARWDGERWHGMDGGITGGRSAFSFPQPGAYALAALPGGDLLVGGNFYYAGGEPMNHLARWDGNSWTPLAVELPASYTTVRDIAVLPSGDIVVAGIILDIAGEPMNHVARWDGSQWSALGGGVESVLGLDGAYAVLARGDREVIVGGPITSAGSAAAAGVASWDGSAWSAIGEGLESREWPHFPPMAFDLLSLRAGSVVVAGLFDHVGGQRSRCVGRWDGVKWHPFGEGTAGAAFGRVRALAELPNGNIAVGGDFTMAGGLESDFFAIWGCPDCYADCDGSGSLDFFDFLCFQNLFAAADPRADCDESGQLDFFDFLCFQNAFAAGCE